MRALFFLLAVAVAAPASADFAPRRKPDPVRKADPFLGSGRVPSPGINREVSDIRARIDDARESGAISRREARRLDRQARHLRSLANIYGAHGLSASESRELQARAAYLRDAVSAQRVRTRAAARPRR